MIDSFVEYFSDMPTVHRSMLLVLGLGFFFIIENTFPFFRTPYDKLRHTGINLFFTLTTVLVNFLLAFLLIESSRWVNSTGVGLLNWVQLPIAVQLIAGVLIMDLIGAYAAHYIQHKIPWMWQFHLIHHTDQNLDTTSGNRHHPGESVIRLLFTLVAIIVVGAPIWLIFVYQSLSLVATQFTHSNLNYPQLLDKIFGWLLVTPRMHRVHHHYRMPYSDRNFGNIFSIWDHIFGTYAEVDNAKLIYGVDTHMDDHEHQNLWSMLAIPFKDYKGHIQYDNEEKL